MIRPRSWLSPLAFICLALFASGCSREQQSVAPIPQAAPQSITHGVPGAPDIPGEDKTNIGPLVNVTAKVVVTVPTSAAAAKSVSITVNSGTPTIANLSSGSPGCSGSNPLVCTVSVTAPTASDVFALKTFSGTNGTGSVLASGSLVQTITATSFTVKVTLAGTPNSITLVLKTVSPRECNPSTIIPLYVMVKDSSANIIIGVYGETVTLADSDTSGKTKLSATSVADSSSSVTLTYNGFPLMSAKISATAPGISAANIHDSVLMPSQMIYVLDLSNRAADVFPTNANGNVSPTRRLKMTGPDNGLNQNVLAPNCTMFASDSGSTLIAVFSFAAGANGTVSPLTEITGSKTALLASGVAENPVTGMIYSPISMASTPGIGIWPATATGNVAPSSGIIGTKTMISNPSSLAFDSSGKLYVLAFRNILVFAKGATGNVAPVQNLSTGFFCPDGVAVDGSDQIYVSDNCTAEVKVWAAGATGNAAPLRTITLPSGGGANGVGVDYLKNWYTADTYLSTVYSFGPTASGKAPPRTTLSGSSTMFGEPNYVSL